MKTFNIVSAIVGSIMAAACLWAAFYNPFHIITTAVAVSFTTMALTDDTDGESIISHLYKR